MLWGRFWGHFGAPIILGSHNGLCLTSQTGSIPVQPFTDSSIGMWWLVCRVEQVWHAILKTVVTDTFRLLIEGPFTDYLSLCCEQPMNDIQQWSLSSPTAISEPCVHLLNVPRPKQFGGARLPTSLPPPVWCLWWVTVCSISVPIVIVL